MMNPPKVGQAQAKEIIDGDGVNLRLLVWLLIRPR
jgi:hypothetical protein